MIGIIRIPKILAKSGLFVGYIFIIVRKFRKKIKSQLKVAYLWVTSLGDLEKINTLSS